MAGPEGPQTSGAAAEEAARGGTVNVVSHGKMPGLQCNIAIDG